MARKKIPASLPEAYQQMRADYEMSRDSRFVRKRTGLASRGGSADYHYRNETDYYNDMEKARDMDRNDAITGQTIDRSVANVIQDGFTLSPNTGNKSLDDDLYYRWQEFATDPDECDIAGEMTWHDYEIASFRSHLVDGDSFVWVTTDGPLQFIEAHQIQTPSKVKNTFCGIETDEQRKRLTAYYMADAINPNSLKKGSADPIPFRDDEGFRQVCQIYLNRRAHMTRGVTALAPIFYIAGMFEDINFAKVVQQQIVSCFAIFRQMAAGSPTSPPSTTGYGDVTPTGATAGISFIDGVSPGMEIRGNPGETLQGFSPNVPNAEYFQHVRLLLQIIGVNLGLPLCLVLMDGSETNFSGWRGAVDEARKGFRRNQKNLIKRLHTPVYQMKLKQWMETDRALRAAAEQQGVNIWAHQWQTPEWKYINPKDDAEADAAQLRNCLTSPRRLMGSRGSEWETIVDETVEDNIYAIRKAKKAVAALNAELQDGQPINWRDVLPLVLPQNTSLALQDPAVVGTGETSDTPTGEMAEISTLQFKRNRKAIETILTELQNGETSEAKARVFLQSVGLAGKSIDALIADAMDGSGKIEAIDEQV